MRLNQVCFYVCVVTIVLAVLVALGIVWLPESQDTAWKALTSLCLVFAGGVGTMTVNTLYAKAMANYGRPKSD